MRDMKVRASEFAPIWKGRIACLVRRVEGSADPGSLIRLREFRNDNGPPTGRTIKAIVSHKMEGNGIRDGFTLMSIRIVAKHSPAEPVAIPEKSPPRKPDKHAAFAERAAKGEPLFHSTDRRHGDE